MVFLAEVFLFSALFFVITYGLGIGLGRLLLKEKPMLLPFIAPWIGIVQSGILLTFTGFMGLGTQSSFWIPILFSVLFFLISLYRERKMEWHAKELLALAGTVILFTFILMSPVARKAERLTTFILDNQDPVAYVSSTRVLQQHGLFRYLNISKRKEINVKKLSNIEKVAASQLPLPRWLPMYTLSLLSTLTGRNPADLFSLLIYFLYALFVPMIWILMRETLEMKRAESILGFLLVLSNPHILYIVQRGFLPHVMATGFFIHYLCRIPSLAEKKEGIWNEVILLSLLGTGVIASYQELFPFLLLVTLTYFLYQTYKDPAIWKISFKKVTLMILLVSLLAPYQLYALLTSVNIANPGGWQITNRYYLFLFQLGGYFPRNVMNPYSLLEWILNPFLIFLVFKGLRSAKNRDLMLCTAFPFAVAACITYVNGWNYKYFKNFTYIYFWTPILLAHGVYVSGQEMRRLNIRKPYLRRTIYGLSLILMTFVLVNSATNCAARLFFAYRDGAVIPRGISSLEKVNDDPTIDTVFLQGLDFWESNWVIYYLNNKEIVVPYCEAGVLTEKSGSAAENRFHYILIQDGLKTVFDPLGNRTIEKVIARFGRFSLYQLKKSETAGSPAMIMGTGFSIPKKLYGEEWVLMGQEAELFIDSGKEIPNALFIVELCSRQDQELQLVLNGQRFVSIFLKGEARASYQVRLPPIKRGRNSLIMKTDNGVLPGIENDPRPLNIQFFNIRIATGA